MDLRPLREPIIIIRVPKGVPLGVGGLWFSYEGFGLQHAGSPQLYLVTPCVFGFVVMQVLHFGVLWVKPLTQLNHKP